MKFVSKTSVILAVVLLQATSAVAWWTDARIEERCEAYNKYSHVIEWRRSGASLSDVLQPMFNSSDPADHKAFYSIIIQRLFKFDTLLEKEGLKWSAQKVEAYLYKMCIKEHKENNAAHHY